jgi:hypothetical protein
MRLSLMFRRAALSTAVAALVCVAAYSQEPAPTPVPTPPPAPTPIPVPTPAPARTIGDVIHAKSAADDAAVKAQDAARRASEALDAALNQQVAANADLKQSLTRTGPVFEIGSDGSARVFIPDASADGFHVITPATMTTPVTSAPTAGPAPQPAPTAAPNPIPAQARLQPGPGPSLQSPLGVPTPARSWRSLRP